MVVNMPQKIIKYMVNVLPFYYRLIKPWFIFAKGVMKIER